MTCVFRQNATESGIHRFFEPRRIAELGATHHHRCSMSFGLIFLKFCKWTVSVEWKVTDSSRSIPSRACTLLIPYTFKFASLSSMRSLNSSRNPKEKNVYVGDTRLRNRLFMDSSAAPPPFRKLPPRMAIGFQPFYRHAWMGLLRSHV